MDIRYIILRCRIVLIAGKCAFKVSMAKDGMMYLGFHQEQASAYLGVKRPYRTCILRLETRY